MTAISFVIHCSFVSHVPIQVNGKQGDSFTPKHHVAHNTGAHTMQTPVPARTILTNNKMGAEPPSLYDGTSSVTQNKGSRTVVPIRRNVNVHSNCTAQCAQVFQHLFLVCEHRPPHSHNRVRSKQCKMFTALTMDTQQVGCAQTTKRCTPARLNQRRTAHQFTQLVHSSQYVAQHSVFVLHRSNSVHSNNRKRTVNVLEVRSATQNTCAQQCNRA